MDRELRCVEDLEEKDESMNEWVCKTAPATPSLLNKGAYMKQHFTIISTVLLSLYKDDCLVHAVGASPHIV